MEWLKEHVYIAGWLSPIIALIGMLIRGVGKSGEIGWERMMLYIAFLTCVAAVFTPTLEAGARGFAAVIVFGLVIFFAGQVEADSNIKRDIQLKEKGLVRKIVSPS
jgi:hypothetical protein